MFTSSNSEGKGVDLVTAERPTKLVSFADQKIHL